MLQIESLLQGRTMRFGREWEIYADDCTIRTGRWIDGTYHSDKEYESSVQHAVKEAVVPQQDFEAAFEAVEEAKWFDDYLVDLEPIDDETQSGYEDYLVNLEPIDHETYTPHSND